MRTIPETVEKHITSSPYLLEAITDNLINLSALARKIKPEIEKELHKEVKDGAIIMALKRFSTNLNHKSTNLVFKTLKKLGDITLRSDLYEYTYKNSDSLRKKQLELLNELKNDDEVFITLCQGIYETSIVISSRVDSFVKKVFKNESCTSNIKDLSSITLKLPKENIKISGIYYYLLKKLAWEGINIVEVISTTNEFTIILHQDDVGKAFNLLSMLKKEGK